MIVRSIESLLGYLAVVARGLARDDRTGVGGASDLVQMTVAAALGNVAEGKLPSDPSVALKPWLRGIMLNLRSQQRKRKRPAAGLEGEFAADTTSPSGCASRAELVHFMARARARLDDRERQLLAWRHDEELTFDAIGQRLGVSGVMAHKSYRRALKRLELHFLQLTAQRACRRPVG
jgi:RNA polymerase sigma-70 factor (ECF subfamily)